MSDSFRVRCLEVADGSGGGGADRWRQRGGENKPGRIRAYRIDQRARAGDVPADTAEGLGERLLQHVDPLHSAVALRDSGAASPVHANGVHLVGVGHRTITFGEIADAVEG